MWYDTLKNKILWKLFDAISSIPRESGNEEGVRSFIVQWAESMGYEHAVDVAGNVIVRCPATPGYENKPYLALQAHMDMVCVKRPGSKHDFQKDRIEIINTNDIITAKDTSLGADNGIGVAMIMDIMSDKNLEHGPLEGIFTTSEETGLYGAFGINEKDVASRRLINLDSEEDGIFYIGSAGGADVVANLEGLNMKSVSGGQALRIKVSGLLGGHSGGEIHKERANAIKLLSRAIYQVMEDDEPRLASITGGTRRNVIPSTAEAVIVVKDALRAKRAIREVAVDASVEYALRDPDIKIEAEDTRLPVRALGPYDTSDIISVLYASPHGVSAMSPSTPGIVETSTNLAIVEMDEEGLTIEWSVRSLVESARDNAAREVVALAELGGLGSEIRSVYPGWAPNADSPLTKELAAAYESFSGKKPTITSIHAGLECGIINSRVPGMDSVSIGPELHDVHSVNENLDALSAERLDDFLKAYISKK